MTYSILLTFDVEDWFQVENFKKYIPFSYWSNYELRVEKNVHKILDLLDSINTSHPSQLTPGALGSSLCSMFSAPRGLSLSPHHTSRLPPNGKSSPRATFFVLGWIAKHLPHLVREIQIRGHEVASHGYYHILCQKQSTEDLKDDLVKSKKLLEDITGTPINGYRAPGFSINHDILKIIEDSDYFYDSSFNSFKLNRRYGQLGVETNNGSNGILLQISDRFFELPISNLKIGKQMFPWGGGGYFRLIPLQLFKHGVQSILKKYSAYLFYLHPWEIDPDQPKVAEAHMFYKFRHYTNLNKTLNKISNFIERFKECCFQTCYQYVTSHEKSTLEGKP